MEPFLARNRMIRNCVHVRKP